MLRTIRLNGELGKKFGRVHRLDIRSPAEGVRALCAIHPGFEKFLVESTERGVGYRCVVDSDVLPDTSALGSPMSKTFSITPVVTGAGKIGSIILGVVLIAAAFYFAPASVGALGPTTGMGTGIGFMGMTYASVAWLGVAMVMGGVSQLLAPVPKSRNASGETKGNDHFDGPVNTTAQGFPVPIGYGRRIVGSAVISASVSLEVLPTAVLPTFVPGMTGLGI